MFIISYQLQNISKLLTKMQIHHQNDINTHGGIRIQGLGSSCKIKEDSMFEGVPDWINRSLKCDEENQRSLQEKIIELYQLIQKKTVKNIEIKKSNEILKAQVDTYLSIIQKIQKAAQQNTPPNNQSNHYDSHQSYQKQPINQSSQQELVYQVHESKQQYPVFTNQTFHIQRNSVQGDCNSSNTHNIYSKGNEQFATQKQQRISCLQSNEDSENMENATQIYQRNLKSKMVPLFVSVPSTSRSPRATPLMLSPRPSIDHVTPSKLINSNKSFLKKVGHSHNSSTGNLGSKIGTISIQSLWNDTKIQNTKNSIGDEKSRKRSSKVYEYKN